MGGRGRDGWAAGEGGNHVCDKFLEFEGSAKSFSVVGETTFQMRSFGFDTLRAALRGALLPLRCLARIRSAHLVANREKPEICPF